MILAILWVQRKHCLLILFAFFALLVNSNLSLGQEASLETTIQTLKDLIARQEFSDATHVLQKVDVEPLAARSVKKEKWLYLAVEGAGTHVPGIPKWRSQSALAHGQVVRLPGTTDYERTPPESEYQEAAWKFASRFNMYARHFGTTVATDRGEVELSSVGKELFLTKPEWERIPLHARLIIRNMAEELLEKDAKNSSMKRGD